MTNHALAKKIAKSESGELSQLEPKFFSCESDFIYAGDSRFDATSYSAEAWRATVAIEAVPGRSTPLGRLCGTIWHPVQNQARSNFKRIYVDKEHGIPYVGSREMFFLPLQPEKYLSKKIPKLQDLMVPKGWLLISRSGTVGNVLYVYNRLSECAITDHAIRIEPAKIPAGFLYAFLASRYGQPLITQGTYGSTVDELEPKHIASIPVPLFDHNTQQTIHTKILQAYDARDRSNDLLVKAEGCLFDSIGVEPFDESNIEYFGDPKEVKAFEIDSNDLGMRFDATSHIPVLRSVLHRLQHCKYQLTTIGSMSSDVFQGPRFPRVYVPEAHGKPFIQCSQFPLFRMYDQKFISQKAHIKDVTTCVVELGDVLITRSGTIGRVGFVSRRFAGWVASDDFVRIRCDKKLVDSAFIYSFMASAYGRVQATTQMFGGVVDHINESHIISVCIPDVPRDEQIKIGNIVREAFELRDRANDLEDEAIATIERLIAG